MSAVASTSIRPAIRRRSGRQPTDPSPAALGSYLGNQFYLERPIGSGPTGEVWQAVDISGGTHVALKLIHTSEADSPRFALRFRHLCRSLLPISHPHLVALRDYGYVDGRFFLASELVPGANLARYLARRGGLGPREAAGLALEVCRGLDALHQNGLVHRGIKPTNILIANDDPRVRLSDPGIAATLSASGLSHSHLLRDSLRYLSPEQARGEPTRPASDLYALGVLLFEMLTGRPPFPTGDLWNLVRLHGWGESPSPSRIEPRIPPSLSEIVVRALRKTAGERFASAAEMSAALSAFLAGTGGAAASTDSTSRDWPIAATPALPAIPNDRWNRSGDPLRRRIWPRRLVMGGALGIQFLASVMIGLAVFLPLSYKVLPFSHGQSSVHRPERVAWAGIGDSEPTARPIHGEDRSDLVATPVPEIGHEDLGLTGTGAGSDETRDPSQAAPAPSDPDGAHEQVPSGSEGQAGQESPHPPGPGSDGHEADDEEKESDTAIDHDDGGEFWGIVESMDGPMWQVAGRQVTVSSQTEREGRITVGNYVRVEGTLGSDGVWRALEIELEDRDEDGRDEGGDEGEDD